MLPALSDGDFVLATRFPCLSCYLKPGRMVVFRWQGAMYIKAVESVSKEHVRVQGLHPMSQRSHVFGPIPKAEILGVVLKCFRDK